MTLTKKQNFLMAVRGETPEQVPVSPLIHWRFSEKLLGSYHWKDTIKIHKMLGSTWFRGPISIGPNSDYDVRWGMEIRELPNDDPGKNYARIISNSKGTITGRHKIGFDPKDPTLGFEYEYFVKDRKDWDVVREYWQNELEKAPMPEHNDIDEAAAILGDDGVSSVIINSAFTRLCLMRGMENMMLDMYDIPSVLEELQHLSIEMRKREVESFLQSKGEVLVYDICWLTGMGVSPEMFRKWLFPEMEMICDMVRKGGKYIGLYTLGRIKHFLPAMIEAKPHFIETFEQNEGDITLAEAKQKYGKQICLMGNFNPLILQDGSVEDCIREAKRCLNEAMRGGGYVMVTGCEVPPTTPVDNLKAMVDTVGKFGKY
ncbi:MAG: uroporphyrinogen decarboxylase family protein [Phycisphaerae bacterium]|jgi:uroporphyrinogen decarboxylase